MCGWQSQWCRQFCCWEWGCQAGGWAIRRCLCGKFIDWWLGRGCSLWLISWDLASITACQWLPVCMILVCNCSLSRNRYLLIGIKNLHRHTPVALHYWRLPLVPCSPLGSLYPQSPHHRNWLSPQSTLLLTSLDGNFRASRCRGWRSKLTLVKVWSDNVKAFWRLSLNLWWNGPWLGRLISWGSPGSCAGRGFRLSTDIFWLGTKRGAYMLMGSYLTRLYQVVKTHTARSPCVYVRFWEIKAASEQSRANPNVPDVLISCRPRTIAGTRWLSPGRADAGWPSWIAGSTALVYSANCWIAMWTLTFFIGYINKLYMLNK